MRSTTFLLVLVFLLFAPSAMAQIEDQDVTAESLTSETVAPELSIDDEKRIEKLLSEIKTILQQSREGAEDVVSGIQESTGLTDNQVFGIAVGIVAGAIFADLVGGGGLATIALAAGGGALGNWLMSD